MRIEAKQRIIKTLTIPPFSHTFSVTKQSQKITIHKPKITNTEIIEYTCLNKNNYNRYSSTTSCLGVWWLWIRWGTMEVSIKGWRKCWALNVHRMMLHLHHLCTSFWAWLGLSWWEERRVSEARLWLWWSEERRGEWDWERRVRAAENVKWYKNEMVGFITKYIYIYESILVLKYIARSGTR